ncbi:MAG: porin [Opitutales bacterium]
MQSISRFLLIGAACLGTELTAQSNFDDWTQWLQNKPGLIYDNKENPLVQSFQFIGRFQYQAAYVEGSDVNGDRFNETYDTFRRVRFGVQSNFLNYFFTKVQANLVSDGRFSGNDLDWGYDSLEEAYLRFNLGKWLGDASPMDSLSLTYGRKKFTFGYESHLSSTKLLTVERSALSNKVYGGYFPTGLLVNAKKGDWSYAAALYSSSVDGDDHEAFVGWQDSQIFYFNLGHKYSDELKLGADFVYNDADVTKGEDSLMAYQWATSLNAIYDKDRFGIAGDLIFGNNGNNLGHRPSREGSFYGVMVMPYYWLVQEKLQGVLQLQHMASSKSEGVRINSRYGRAKGSGDVNGGRGDSHQSVYGGLNYYLAGHNAKFQAGIEYQTMDTPGGRFDTVSYVTAFRMFF